MNKEKIILGNGTELELSLIHIFYNHETRSLSISNAFGDVNIRAGCMIVAKLDLDDIQLNNLMLVEKCKHTFKENEHFMELTLRGGGIDA